MSVQKLLDKIDGCISAANTYIKQYVYSDNTIKYARQVILIVTKLKNDLTSQPPNLNIIVLRAMHDVGIMSYKIFENTTLEDAINNVTDILYNEIPAYKQLAALDTDLDKVFPVL